MKKKLSTKPICIIPARGGSTRIKNKNVINFAGKPIISYAIKTAIKSKIFSKVIVTTDNLRIKNISQKYGAEVPFIRSKKLSDNSAGTDLVIKDCIKKINSQYVEFHFCIYPCSPLIGPQELKKSLNKIKKLRYDKLTTISKYSSSPERSFLKKKEKIFFNKMNSKNKKGQDLKNYYYDTGNIVVYRTSKLLKSKKIFFPKKATFLLLPFYKSIDINTYEDLEIAKFLFHYKNKNNLK